MKIQVHLIITLFCVAAAQAAPVLNPLFSDRAVLQRDVVLPIFGTAKPGEKISVILGARSARTVADAQGQWRTEFPPSPANRNGIQLEVQGEEGEPLRVLDLLFGDVWLLGGQSNMRHAFQTYPILKDTTASINDSELRIVIVNHQTSPGSSPVNPIKAEAPFFHPLFKDSWQKSQKPFVNEFSPAGFYFGEVLRRELQVPVGLILSAVGGTAIERWLPKQEADRAKFGAFFADTPSDLYERMIAPLRGFAMRGIAWYQGESNARDPLSYGPLLESLVCGWRRELGMEERPFLVVQIAPFEGGSGQIIPESWAWLREQQAQVSRKISNAGLIVTSDLGEAEDIHPQNKAQVGERLALWALRDAGKSMQAASPFFQKYEVIGNKLLLYFCEFAGELKSQRVAMNRRKNLAFGQDPEAAVATADKLVGFQICGPDHVFHSAEAKINGDHVVLSSSAVPMPIAARYAWGNFPLGNLFGGTGLPAAPFRTDNFSPPDFGLPMEGQLAPAEPTGQPLLFVKEGIENPYAPQTVISGREAHTVLKTQVPDSKMNGRYVYAKFPEGTTQEGEPTTISIIYYDDFCGIVKVRYDSADDSVHINPSKPGAFKELGHFRMTGSRAWKTVDFKMTDGAFKKRCNGADIRLESQADKDFTIASILLQ